MKILNKYLAACAFLAIGANQTFSQTVIEMPIAQNPLFEVFTDNVNTTLPGEGATLSLGADLIVKGGSGEYTYRWYTPDGAELGNESEITVNAEGIYMLDISDSCDCMQTVAFDITTAGVNDALMGSFTVSPNPTTDGYVEFSGVSPVQLTVVSLSGALCAYIDNGGEPFTSADLSMLAPGNYILTVTDSDGKVYTSRIIKK